MALSLLTAALYLLGAANSFAPISDRGRPQSFGSSGTTHLHSTAAPPKLEPSPTASALKAKLLQALDNLRHLQERDGDFAVDFGVKGGELNATDRAPQQVNYYTISDDVGMAADNVTAICDELAQVSPVEEATMYLGDRVNGALCPLNGEWRQLFTNSADGVFTKNSTRGAATARVIINGTMVNNVIDFMAKDDGTEPALKQLVVKVKAFKDKKNQNSNMPNRVNLQFRYVKAVLSRKLFGRNLALYIPVPGPFLTRIIVTFANLLRIFSKKPKQEIPKAYFDVLYLDKNLRIQKTAQGNLFVQAKEDWSEAMPLLK